MKKILFAIIPLLVLTGCSVQEKQPIIDNTAINNSPELVGIPAITSIPLEGINTTETMESKSVPAETDTKPTIDTNLECDGAGCIDYNNFFGGVSKNVARLISIYYYNVWDYKNHYYNNDNSVFGNTELMNKVLQDMKLSDQEVINHIKNIDLINEYYGAVNDKKYDYALSLTTGSKRDANRYSKTYSGYWNWIGTERGEVKYKYTYKGNNTYYFGVIITSYLGDMVHNETYGITKQIVDGKIKSISSSLLSTFETADGYGEKPVIYLYPTKPTAVSVKINLKGIFSTTYPEIGENNTRNVIANPDGELINKADDNKYSYIFWEAKKMKPWSINEGFVIEKKNYTSFLKEKLTYLGLTPNEYNEFIVYRLPLMNQHPYAAIRFAGKDYTDQAQLTIIPKPDSIQRIFMVFKGLDKPISIPEQKLQSFTRTGFSAIEWGGAQTY
ncbi:hypothetical protein P148_SR1C00001G0277 [candidate division SR1 bacterium RAAC1_SR1_1]|nr:hypothetical protein P148_SR1C00001G0277 [candidate division SR1 bacterium RAAC1_SR1_1]